MRRGRALRVHALFTQARARTPSVIPPCLSAARAPSLRGLAVLRVEGVAHFRLLLAEAVCDGVVRELGSAAVAQARFA